MNIKQYKNELIIIAIYLLIFGTLYYFFTTLKSEQLSIKSQEEVVSKDYNNLKNNNLTEESLQAELDRITKEAELAIEKLPQDLTIQKVNEMLIEISQETGNIFFLKDCKVSEEKPGNNSTSNYKIYKVDVKKIYGSYWQYKDLLKYIQRYDKKVVVSSLNVNRSLNDEVTGSLTLEFYGLKP